jgi:AraC-like DNA-binding protein
MSNADHWINYIAAAGVILAQTRCTGDWGVLMEARQGTYFYFVVEGISYFSMGGSEPTKMSPGDLVVIAQGESHQLKHSPNSEVVPLDQFINGSNHPRSRDQYATTIMGGYFGIDRHVVLPAIKSLPSALHLRADHGEITSSITETLKQLRSEIESVRLGNKILIRHLLSTLFIYVLREWSETAPAEAGTWSSAMQDPHIARALACIHDKPADNWTLQSLADVAGLSRSAFARHFRESVGEPPCTYLTKWRLGLAAQLLSQDSLSIGEIAYRVGYQSEYSFNRAFRQFRGQTAAKERESRQGNPSPYQLFE